jgi:hypothetical protein
MTFKIGNGVRYTPDWTAWLAGRLTAWETKGPHARDDSIVKLKVAAATWRNISFVLAWRDSGRSWRLQPILP